MSLLLRQFRKTEFPALVNAQLQSALFKSAANTQLLDNITQLTRCESLGGLQISCEWCLVGNSSSNVFLSQWIVFPFGTNHTDISAFISMSLASVYLQWHFSSFHCLLTLVILLYLLVKHSQHFLQNRPPYTLNTFYFLSPLSLSPAFYGFSFFVSHIFHIRLCH